MITLVSIHAPARGATRTIDKVIASVGAFQSTHPRGVRHGSFLIGSTALFVSIHAPARGATCKYCSSRNCRSVSIHAPARGATPTARCRRYPYMGFNPRTREGCDANLDCKSSTCRLFQSTHPRGVRRGMIALMIKALRVSIHAPARGATPSN
ncbi:Octaprenyl diphosphate synthase / Dimethylallyltransferase / (2E,6E)-farnesyl diphosphate synthase / Geranylgeranyl pyrophosphate synthetase [Olavius algarvensis spirochete endosymbiont]|nr:Octaprenyl diphosphate synthase / Dimethylallyltransferase / (2E,6E)-farnesyl diphosphate synthase / Geranylgeranyl pyrophosphate synthetase [Olavius algarvensis spirochete endosymbiont]